MDSADRVKFEDIPKLNKLKMEYWIAELAKSGISAEEFARQHLQVDQYGDLLFPIHDLDGRPGYNLRGEPDEFTTKRLRHPKGGAKYLSPKGREIEPYLPVLDHSPSPFIVDGDGGIRETRRKESSSKNKIPTTWRACRDAAVTIFGTEGAKKAICGVVHGLPTFSLPGIFSYSTKNDADQSVIIRGLRELPIVKNQRIGIVYDQESDPVKARNAMIAATRLAKILAGPLFGAKPFIVKLKCPCLCKGMDDYLVKHGRKGFDKLERITQFEEVLEWFVPTDTIVNVVIEWLAEDRIFLGGLNYLYGTMDIGKSTLAAHFVYCVVKCLPLFGDGPVPDTKRRRVIYFAGERALGITKARVHAAGLTEQEIREYVTFVPMVLDTINDDVYLVTLNDLKHYRGLAAEAALIIFDVLDEFIPDASDPKKATPYKKLMVLLDLFGSNSGAAILALAHTNRNAEVKSALQRVGGSYAVPQISASALYLGILEKDATLPKSEQRRVISMSKDNYAKERALAKAFKIVDVDKATRGMGKVAWETDDEDFKYVTPDQLLDSADKARVDGRKKPKLEHAEDMIKTLLMVGPIELKMLKTQVLRTGVKEKTFRDALEALKKTHQLKYLQRSTKGKAAKVAAGNYTGPEAEKEED